MHGATIKIDLLIKFLLKLFHYKIIAIVLLFVTSSNFMLGFR